MPTIEKQKNHVYPWFFCFSNITLVLASNGCPPTLMRVDILRSLSCFPAFFCKLAINTYNIRYYVR